MKTLPIDPDSLIVPRLSFPEKGRTHDAVLQELRERKQGDADWPGGRVPLFVFRGNDDAFNIGRDAFIEYFTENALGAARAFPSVRGMEQEVIGMVLDLFHAPARAAGFMTTGGTESIILAVQACRNHARAQRDDPHHRGNIVAAESAHPAFDKAAGLMDLTVRRVPVDASFRANPERMRASIDDNTIMLVGSAPCFPFGVFDPITGLASLAKEKQLWLHVDACVGGYLAPFAVMLGRDIPAFDLGVDGVSSLSADLHKYGYCPKPASTVLYADASLAAYQPFQFDRWPNGNFTTSTIVGTRPAGGVAGAWATLQLLGSTGYQQVAGQLLAAIDQYCKGVNALPGLSVLGQPELAIVAFTSEDRDIFSLAQALQALGWQPGLLQNPRAIHRMMSMLHVNSMDAYLSDLARTLPGVGRADASQGAGPVRYT
ncbi:MAG: aspartate aminotransferase family protein [Burkholderiaceae bacterium]